VANVVEYGKKRASHGNCHSVIKLVMADILNKFAVGIRKDSHEIEIKNTKYG